MLWIRGQTTEWMHHVFHPTAAGYEAYADAISAALPSGWLNKQSPVA
jgi:hypothetical protein